MYYVGVDLGGTSIKAAIVSEEGKILVKDSVPTYAERSSGEILKDMAMLIKGLISDAGLSEDQIQSIGVGSPGTPDVKNGVLLYANNFADFNNAPIRAELQKYLDLPVYLENDANAAALGESMVGAGREYGNCVAVTLGTGVGGGIIIDGKVYAGSFHGGAELGHTVIEVGGEQCSCGRKGCWEAYSSATAIIRDGRIAAARYPKCLINEYVDGDLSKVNAKVVFDAYHEGDEYAKEVVERYIKYLAIGIVNTINLLEPEVLVIGGGVSAQKDNLLNPLMEYVKGEVYGGEPKTKIKIAELGNDAGLIGAAFLGKIGN
ncbi:ROK family protein [Vallitalea okinawensis]|uniref:ROK family protein n=1 Tax=Vallitalea okinawensis TaxID=2078660 RepID=UPI000CFC81DE|nr:ROK family protein [Vallitalea okinawensis]